MILFSDGSRCLRILHCQNNRAAGHGILRFAKKTTSNNVSPLVPSRDDAGLRVDRGALRAWRSSHPAGRHQRLRSHSHVLLLHAVGFWARGAKVPLVEEVPDLVAAGAVRHCFGAQRATILHRLQLFENFGLPPGHQRRTLHLPVWLVLREKLHQEQPGADN